MRHNRLPRLLGALGLAISLTAGTLAGTTVAATPHWDMHVTRWVPSLGGVPTVSNNDTAAYSVTITNNGPSNISQLYLETMLGGATGLVATPDNGSSCDAATVACNLGTLRANSDVTVFVVVRTPASGKSLSILFEANTTGASPNDKGKNSHGDALDYTATVSLTSSQDFAGRYIYDSTQQQVGTNTSLNNGNPQSTTVFAPVTGIVTSANEFSSSTCPVTRCVGQWSGVNVDGGTPYPGGFRIVITISRSVLPRYIDDDDDLNIVHQLDDGTFEYLIAEDHHDWCAFDSGATTPNNMPCLTETMNSSQFTVTIWTTTNGNFRGY